MRYNPIPPLISDLCFVYSVYAWHTKNSSMEDYSISFSKSQIHFHFFIRLFVFKNLSVIMRFNDLNSDQVEQNIAVLFIPQPTGHFYAPCIIQFLCLQCTALRERSYIWNNECCNFKSVGVVFSPPGVHYLVNHPLNFDAMNIGLNLSSFLFFCKIIILQITRSPLVAPTPFLPFWHTFLLFYTHTVHFI